MFRDYDCELMMDLGDHPKDFVAKYPDECKKIYKKDPPACIPKDDIAEIMFLDSLSSCRGANSHWSQFTCKQEEKHMLLHVGSPQGQMVPNTGQMQMAQVQNMMMQMMQTFMAQNARNEEGSLPGLQIRGKPMRRIVDEPIGGHEMPSLEDGMVPPDLDLASKSDGLEKVAERMLARGKGGGHEADHNANHEADHEADASRSRSRSRADRKDARITKQTPKKKMKKTKEAIVKEQITVKQDPKTRMGKASFKSPATWAHPLNISWERSRQQVMGRTGKGGSGSSVAFKYKTWGGEAKAYKAAQQWLNKQKLEYTLAKKKKHKVEPES